MKKNHSTRLDTELEPDPALAPTLDQLSRRRFLGRASAGAAGVVTATLLKPADAAKLRDAMKAHHKTAEIYVYEGAGHAFNNDTRESYRAEPAKLAWKRTLEWFEKYLR